MKKIFLPAMMAMTALCLQAQDNITLDTYIGAQLATEDLNGTARYVGMGGAMDALGADLTTMGTNPAGIGLYRHTQVAGSLSMLVQEDGKTFQDGSKTTVSFDQIGIVFARRQGMSSYLTGGFNFRKNRNFNQVLSAANRSLNGSSQNRQTVIKGINGDLDTYWGESQVDNLYYSLVENKDGSLSDIDATDYEFDRAHTGYIGEYDFNLSGNINNRVYLGVTFGVKDVHYNAYSEYFEHLNSLSMPSLTSVLMTDQQKITGQGIDVKAGVIFRPVEESPFRVGLSVATPTYYNLTTSNTTRIGDVEQIGYDADFCFNTPWKFAVSAGHTVGNQLAIGATYEYSDYTTLDMRVIDGHGSYWSNASTSSSSDPEMRRLTERTLSGVSTVKVGAEFKPDPNLALRLGYNYSTAMYKDSGVRDQTIPSPGTYMASTTDYTNWKDTHRITAGVGFTFDQWRLDLAYQYSMRQGDFYPFMQNAEAKYYDSNNQVQVLRNSCEAVKVNDNRHQLMATLTYTY